MQQRQMNGNATLTEEEVRHIRGLLDTKEASAADLARSYRVSAETIRRIGRRETWGWIEGKVERLQSSEISTAAKESFEKLMKMNPELAEQLRGQQQGALSATDRMTLAVKAEKAAQGLGDQMLNELQGGESGTDSSSK